MLDFYKEGGGFYEEEDGLVTYCSVISRGLRTSFLWEVYGVEVTTRGLCRDPTILSFGCSPEGATPPSPGFLETQGQSIHQAV